MKTYCKLARPDGWDFYTGMTINYRENIGKIVLCPNQENKAVLCSNTVIHASLNPNDCFIGAKIPCSAYKIMGKPVIEDQDKCGFKRIKIIKEIIDLDELFGWKYSEAVAPYNPLKIEPPVICQTHIKLLKNWASVWASVWDSVWDSVRDSVGDSVWDSAWAYYGSFFILYRNDWKYTEKIKTDQYPFLSSVKLWEMGLVPSFDGEKWRLHGGKDAKVLWEGFV